MKEEYNQSSHLKISKPKIQNLIKKQLEEAELKAAELEKKCDIKINPDFNLNEQYAQDLIMISILLAMIEKNLKYKNKEEFDKQLEEIKKHKAADQNLLHNAGVHDELKKNYKFLKIVQAKQKTEKDPQVVEKLKKDEQKAKQKLEALAKKFDFHTEGRENVLKFTTLSQALEFLDKIEKQFKETSYRMDITDAEELQKIAETKPSDLYSLAEETADKSNSYNKSMTDAAINETLEEIKEVAKSATKVASIGV